MTPFWALVEKYITEQIISNTPLVVLLLLSVLILVAVVVIRTERAVRDKRKQTERVDRLERQQIKLIQLITRAPCVSKNNATWLQDHRRNGGQPPEIVKCKYEWRLKNETKQA